VCGVGIIRRDNKLRLANNYEWKKYISPGNLPGEISGHYVAFSWDAHEVKIETDKLGLRDIYYAEIPGGIIISTRVDWIAKYKKLEIGFSEFSTRWLLFNQISHNSIVKGCSRLVAGQKIRIDIKTLRIYRVTDSFKYPAILREKTSLDSILSEYLSIPDNEKKKLSLSLSGGMDSRVILSILLKMQLKDWDTHTFGTHSHPDSEIAEAITEKLNVPHFQIDEKLPGPDETLCRLQEYTNTTLVNNPASAIKQLLNYSRLNSADSIITDGGFGEIWRREFLFKLQVKGKNAVINKDSKLILGHMKHFRADIFEENTNRLMEGSAIEQLNEMMGIIPSPSEIGIENWLDFFAIKTRLPNYYGHEQARLDEYVTSFMPFVQQDVLDLLFSYRVNQRKNGKLFRKILSGNCPALKTFPLVKGTIKNPFVLNSLQARIYSFIRKKFSKNVYINKNNIDFLNMFRDYLNDIINSRGFSNFEHYDHDKIKKLVGDFYKGNTSRANELDWFLSFELFRQCIYD
jgi:hypothetical protein